MTHFEEALQDGGRGGKGGGEGGEGRGRGALECFEEDGAVLVMQGVSFAQDVGEIDGDTFFLIKCFAVSD